MSDLLCLIAIAAPILALLFLLAWAWQLRSKDATPVDILWTLSVAGIVIVGALVLDGDPLRRSAVAAIMILWALRLLLHLITRWRHAGVEDSRYAHLRRRSGPSWRWVSLLIYALQVAAVLLIAIAPLAVATDEHAIGTPTDVLGLIIILIGIGTVTLADRQLEAWRRDPALRGTACRAGLWAWSRHPNYFGEWLFWLGLACIASGATPWWPGWITAATMLLLICFVSGIPPAERQARRSRRWDYRHYQATTSPFVPLPPHPRCLQRRALLLDRTGASS